MSRCPIHILFSGAQGGCKILSVESDIALTNVRWCKYLYGPNGEVVQILVVEYLCFCDMSQSVHKKADFKMVSLEHSEYDTQEGNCYYAEYIVHEYSTCSSDPIQALIVRASITW